MFYQPGVTPHNLPYDPFKSCVVPRPIGWISTLSPDGKHANLAPYSQFQNLTFDPPYIMFAANQSPSNRKKDTTHNAEQTGRFNWNMATYALRHAVAASAQELPYTTDEFAHAGVAKAPSTLSAIPMVAESPIRFECEYHSTLRLPGNPPMGSVSVVIGRVVGVHIADEALGPDGRIDLLRIRPIARCGYFEYTVINEVFEMRIPGDDGRVERGLEGSVVGNALTREENERRQKEGGENGETGKEVDVEGARD